MTKTFEPGDIGYTREGRKAMLVARDGASFIVKLAHRYHIDGDDYEEEFDKLCTVDKFHREPPVEVYTQELDALSDKADKLRSEIASLDNGLRAKQASSAELLKKLARFDALRDLEAYIDGKITHFVIENFYEVQIAGKDDALDENPREKWDKRQKLVVLFGDTKGNLSWGLNQYRDGSGSSWQRVYPCLSLDEAKAKATELIMGRLELYVAGERTAYVDKLIAGADRYGIPVPDAARSKLKVEQLASLKLQVERFKGEHDKAVAALAKAELTQ